MTYRALCCGVVVIGKVEWIALQVPDPEHHCPACGSWTKFAAITEVEKAAPARARQAA